MVINVLSTKHYSKKLMQLTHRKVVGTLYWWFTLAKVLCQKLSTNLKTKTNCKIFSYDTRFFFS